MTEPNFPSDDKLLRQMLAGDEEAFVALYQRRQRSIYRFALQMTGSGSIAEDVTQEVFVTLMKEGQNYEPTRGTLAAYLYGIARHYVLRSLEKSQCHVSIADDFDDDGNSAQVLLAAPDDPLEDLSRHERIESVRQAVLSLPNHYREVVVLCDLQDMSYAEAASTLGLAVGTVRSRLHRAHALLTEKLKAHRMEDTPSPRIIQRGILYEL
jgi:RNA polymerase sigma-70 factor (ECF subfamily)